jgi:hypothetical protein
VPLTQPLGLSSDSVARYLSRNLDNSRDLSNETETKNERLSIFAFCVAGSGNLELT